MNDNTNESMILNQSRAILNHLMQGQTITPMEALNLFGCLRLSARICDLRRQGHRITATIIPTPNGKHVARYSLENKTH